MLRFCDHQDFDSPHLVAQINGHGGEECDLSGYSNWWDYPRGTNSWSRSYSLSAFIIMADINYLLQHQKLPSLVEWLNRGPFLLFATGQFPPLGLKGSFCPSVKYKKCWHRAFVPLRLVQIGLSFISIDWSPPFPPPIACIARQAYCKRLRNPVLALFIGQSSLWDTIKQNDTRGPL